MKSIERVLTAISHKEPDRVPLCLLLASYGAKEAKTSIKEYFSDPALVAKTQLEMVKKYDNDFLFNFYYAALEFQAFGGGVIYGDNVAPNSGKPFIEKSEDILSLKVPSIEDNEHLSKVLQTTRLMKEMAKDEIPIIGVVMSPFSLPIMQMGFKGYINLIYDEPEMFEKLMKINKEFCIKWANAQLDAGATVICYFDPMSSTTFVPKSTYLKHGRSIAIECIEKINGPVITHFATGKCVKILDEVITTGTVAVGVSTFDDMNSIKEICKNKVSIVGNLNGMDMRHWSKDDVDRIVKKLIQEAGEGGGFILSDNHGEIPCLVPEEVLMNISKAVKKYGKYPLEV